MKGKTGPKSCATAIKELTSAAARWRTVTEAWKSSPEKWMSASEEWTNEGNATLFDPADEKSRGASNGIAMVTHLPQKGGKSRPPLARLETIPEPFSYPPHIHLIVICTLQYVFACRFLSVMMSK